MLFLLIKLKSVRILNILFYSSSKRELFSFSQILVKIEAATSSIKILSEKVLYLKKKSNNLISKIISFYDSEISPFAFYYFVTRYLYNITRGNIK